MRRQSPFAVAVSGIALALFLAIAAGILLSGHRYFSVAVAVAGIIVALLLLVAIEIADQWERVIVLRLGKYQSLRGPGLFFIIPIIDSVPYWIDMRVITVSFKAEKTLTMDTVPVDVDAVMFWKVIDPEKAALAVAEYRTAIGWAAQTALRDVIDSLWDSSWAIKRADQSGAAEVPAMTEFFQFAWADRQYVMRKRQWP